MDYVLFGMGYGATLMLLGWALRTFGPDRKYKDVDPEDIDASVLQRRWIRFIQGLGGVIAIAGTAMVVFTFIVMLVNPDDETGGFISLAIWGFLAVAILIWCWFYVSTFGATGVWSRNEGYGFRRGSSSANTSSVEAGLSSSRVVPKPRVKTRQHEIEIGPQLTESTDTEIEGTTTDAPVVETVEADDPVDDPEQDLINEEAPAVSDIDTETPEVDGSDPEYDFGDSTDTTVPKEIGGRSEAIRRIRERQSRTDNSKS